MAKFNYHGCDNAESATAKVISTSTYDYSKKTTFFGNLEDAIKYYSVSVKVDEGAHFSLHYYEIYSRGQEANKWIEIEVPDEVIESIWASSAVNPANKVAR